MTSLFTLRTTFILFFIFICQFSLKAQNSTTIVVPDRPDTIKIMVIVNPGQNGAKPTITVSAEPKGAKTTNPTGVSAPSTGQRTGTATKATGPVAPVKVIPTTGISAPSTAEKAGTATYMTRPVPAKAKPTGYSSPNTAQKRGTADYMTSGTTKTATTTPVTPANTIATPGIPTHDTSTTTPAKVAATTLVTVPSAKKDSVKRDSAKKSELAIKKDISAEDTIITKSARMVFIEFGGPGLAITANFDGRFKHTQDGFGFRVGAGYYGTGGNTVFTIPIQVNYLTGDGANYLELGGGTTFLHSNGNNYGSKHFIFDKVTGFIGTSTIGYRYAPEGKRFNCRVSFVGLFSDEGITPVGGVSFGYSF